MVGTLASSSSSGSSMAEEKALIKQLAQSAKEVHFSSKLIEEEVFAAQTMQKLTARFGTRGKSAKSIFLQGFRDEVLGKGKKHFLRILRQTDPDDPANLKKDSESVITNTTGKTPYLSDSKSSSKSSSKIITRPAAMVLYSKFCNRLEMLIRNQVFHLGLVPPPVETAWLYDEARQDSYKLQQNDTTLEDTPFEIMEINNMLNETEEKMSLRLKIYKRALSALILHCEALRPLLREIKRSYDSVLKLREWQLQEIGWITQNILTAQKEMQEKTHSVGFEAFSVIKLMDNQCKQLMHHIDKQDAAIKVMTDILNTLENSLGDEHECRRDSDDQNKMFIKDINALRRKLGMPPRPEEGTEVTQVEEVEAEEAENTELLFVYTPDDPLILRKALDICRHDLFVANQRMEALEEEHKGEVPRRRFEQMKKDLAELEADYVKLQEQMRETQSQVQGTKDQIEKLTQERDLLKKQAAELRIKITPRPSWEKVGEFVDGGVPKWRAIYEGKTSMEISNKVIDELNAKKSAAPPEYLSALGMDPEVPRCLLYDTRVRDRRLARRDAEVIICNIWNSRLTQLDSVKRMKETGEYGQGQSTNFDDDDPFGNSSFPIVQDFPEFVAQYFEEKFPEVTQRMEWTYNIIDACKRLTMNQKLSQFQGILMGRIDEGCYHLVRMELNRLHDILHARSSELARRQGSMSLGEFRQLLEEIYPHKNEDEIKSLIRVTSKQTKCHASWTVFNYESLFAESDEGFEGEFVEEFSKQIDQDRMTYIHEIIRGLLQDLGLTYDYEAREEDSPGDTEIHMLRFYKTLIAVDPDIKDEGIGSMIAWVYARVSCLPGLGPVGLLLVDYLKTRVHTSEGVGQDIADDLEFDKAMKDLKGDIAGVSVDVKQGTRTQKTNQQQVKHVKLRVLIRRLKEGAFMHQGTKVKTPTASMKNLYAGEYEGEGYYDFNEEGYNEEEQEEEDDSKGLTTI